MHPLDRRLARRLVLAAAVTVAGAVALAAAPATAKPAAKPKAAPVARPVEGPTCLFPIPGQECSEEERRLCDAPAAPDPVVVDCHDPANAWVLEMVGECDMPHLSDQLAAGGRERERPHDQSCLDSESCGRAPSAAAPFSTTLQHQPAIDRASPTERPLVGRLSPAPVIVRNHPGFARGIDHPPKP